MSPVVYAPVYDSTGRLMASVAALVPGPWFVSQETGVSLPFTVARLSAAPLPFRTYERLMRPDGSSLAFSTLDEALAAIAKATDRIGYVDCGECPRISTGCEGRCDKAPRGAA